jgi:anti-anti-sigma factor
MQNPNQPDDDGSGRTPLTIQIYRAAGSRRLMVSGELDIATYDRFCRALLDEADRQTREPLSLDLTGVDYMDRQTWELIATVRRRLTANGRPFSVALVSGEQPERLYRLLQLDYVVPRI